MTENKVTMAPLFTEGEIRRMNMDQLLKLAAEVGLYVWNDSQRSGIVDALVDKLVKEEPGIWCTYRA